MLGAFSILATDSQKTLKKAHELALFTVPVRKEPNEVEHKVSTTPSQNVLEKAQIYTI